MIPTEPCPAWNPNFGVCQAGAFQGLRQKGGSKPGDFQREAPDLDVWQQGLCQTQAAAPPSLRTNPLLTAGAPQLLQHCFNCQFFTPVWAGVAQKDEPWHIMQTAAPHLCPWIPPASKVNISLPFLWTKMQQFFLQGLRGNEKEKKYCLTMGPKVWKSYRDRYFCLFQKSTLHSCHAKIIPALFNLWDMTPKSQQLLPEPIAQLLNSLLK